MEKNQNIIINLCFSLEVTKIVQKVELRAGLIGKISSPYSQEKFEFQFLILLILLVVQRIYKNH